MKTPRASMWLVLAGLVLVVGCSDPRFYDRRTEEVTPAAPITIPIDAAKRERVITVQAKSSGPMFDIHLFLSKDQEGAESSIFGNKSELLLDSAKKTQEATVEATVPAGEELMVFVIAAENKTLSVELEMHD